MCIWYTINIDIDEYEFVHERLRSKGVQIKENWLVKSKAKYIANIYKTSSSAMESQWIQQKWYETVLVCLWKADHYWNFECICLQVFHLNQSTVNEFNKDYSIQITPQLALVWMYAVFTRNGQCISCSHLQHILWNKHLKFQSKLKLYGTNYLIESSWRTKGKRWFYRCKVDHLHWTTFVWLNFIQFEAIHNPEPFAYTVQSITYQLCNGVRNSNHWDIPYASHGCILWWFELEHTN